MPIPTITLEVLRTWCAQQQEMEWVFPRKGDKTAFPGEYSWQAALLRAGLAGDFHFHDLRHTAASYLAMSGASLIEIAEVLGHKTLAVLRRYAHFSSGHISDLVGHMSQKFLGSDQSQEGAQDDQL